MLIQPPVSLLHSTNIAPDPHIYIQYYLYLEHALILMLHFCQRGPINHLNRISNIAIHNEAIFPWKLASLAKLGLYGCHLKHTQLL